MTHVKIPQDRIGALIGPKGQVKELIERKSSSKLEIDGDNGAVEVISGEDPVGALRALDVIKAIGRGFNPEKAMEIFDDDMLMLEVIDLSHAAATQKELQRVKGRIIGRGGKAREIMESTLGVKVSVYGKTISIIGTPEKNLAARTAIEMLLDGVPHGNVYSFLEKKRQELVLSQLDSY